MLRPRPAWARLNKFGDHPPRSTARRFDATVEVYGLPTLADVAAVKRDFHEGLRGLGEIVSATMWGAPRMRR